MTFSIAGNNFITTMKLDLLILCCLFVGCMSFGEEENACYAAFCDDVISSCRNFDNNFINCDDIQFQPANGTDGEEAMSLNGFITILADLDEGITMLLEVAKETDIGDEPVSSFAVDLCESLKKDDTPWAAVVKEMQLTECPIKTGKYYLSNLVLSLGGMKLTHDMCGEYQAKFIMMKETEELSCHVISLLVDEVPCE